MRNPFARSVISAIAIWRVSFALGLALVVALNTLNALPALSADTPTTQSIETEQPTTSFVSDEDKAREKMRMVLQARIFKNVTVPIVWEDIERSSMVGFIGFHVKIDATDEEIGNKIICLIRQGGRARSGREMFLTTKKTF